MVKDMVIISSICINPLNKSKIVSVQKRHLNNLTFFLFNDNFILIYGFSKPPKILFKISKKGFRRFFIAKKLNKNQIKLARSPPLQVLKIEHSKFGGKENERLQKKFLCFK